MNCTPEQIEQAVRNCQAQRDFADNFNLIYECYGGRVFRFFKDPQNNISKETCEELTQDVFFAVSEKIGSLKNASSFESWLFAIAKNDLRDYWSWQRAEKRAGERYFISPDNPSYEDGANSVINVPDRSPESTPMAIALSKEQEQKVRDFVLTLPPRMRDCMLLRMEGHKYQEIADLLLINTGAVSAHLSQARRRIAEYLGSNYGESNK